MATTIKLKNGSGAPLAGDLVQGEPALDLTNKRLYTEDSGGTVIEVGTNPTSLTTGTFTSTGIDDNATSTAITIDSSENVGIGTNTPQRILDISSATSANIVLERTGATTSALVFNAASGETQIISRSSNSVDGSVPLAFQTGGSTRLKIDGSGNVGIGTTSPSDKLELYSGSPAIRLNDTVGYHRLEGYAGDLYVTADQGNGAGAGNIIFRSNGTTERMRIDSSGNVGIGTTSPSDQLEVSAASPAILITDTDTSDTFRLKQTNTLSEIQASTDFAIDTNGSEAMRIDSSGNVGIGTASPNRLLCVEETSGGCVARFTSSPTDTTTIQLGNTGDENEGQIQYDNSNNFMSFTANAAERMRIDTSGNVGIGTSSPTSKLHVRDVIRVSTSGTGDTATDGTVLSVGASGEAYLYNYESQPLIFATSNTERMRIDSSGNLLVGKTAINNSINGYFFDVASNGYASFVNTGTASSHRNILCNRQSGDGDTIQFQRGGVLIGSISVTSSAVSYNTTSDERLKENIVDAPAGNIDAIRVRSFDWKIDGSHQTYGMVAQELVDVAPEAVTQGEIEDDMWSVDYSKLVPMMIKEIQDLKAEVAALKGA